MMFVECCVVDGFIFLNEYRGSSSITSRESYRFMGTCLWIC